MAVTDNSSTIHFSASGDIFNTPLDILTLVLCNTTAAVVDVTVAQGNDSSLIAIIVVPADSTVTIPFGKAKLFPGGLRFTGVDCTMTAFLA